MDREQTASLLELVVPYFLTADVNQGGVPLRSRTYPKTVIRRPIVAAHNNKRPLLSQTWCFCAALPRARTFISAIGVKGTQD